MKSMRQLTLALLLALIGGMIVFGSISLSMAESGFALAQAGTPGGFFLIPGDDDLKLVGGRPAQPAEGGAAATPAAQQNAPQEQIATCPDTPTDWTKITIAPDDTLRSLAERYQTSVDILMTSNCLSIDRVPPGSDILVPPLPVVHAKPTQPCYPRQGWIAYSVRPGDTLYNLGRSVGVSASEIMAASCLQSLYISVGEIVRLPYYPVALPPTPLPQPPPIIPTPALPTPWTTPYVPTPTTETPIATVPVTTEPPSYPPPTEPPITTPPLETTEAPIPTEEVTQPPVTEEPIATEEPAPQPSETEPPVSEPPETDEPLPAQTLPPVIPTTPLPPVVPPDTQAPDEPPTKENP